jgi:hypothetical protein
MVSLLVCMREWCYDEAQMLIHAARVFSWALIRLLALWRTTHRIQCLQGACTVHALDSTHRLRLLEAVLAVPRCSVSYTLSSRNLVAKRMRGLYLGGLFAMQAPFRKKGSRVL